MIGYERPGVLYSIIRERLKIFAPLLYELLSLSLSLCEYYITFQQAHALNTFVLSGDLRIIDQVSKNFDEKQNIAFQIKWMQN